MAACCLPCPGWANSFWGPPTARARMWCGAHRSGRRRFILEESARYLTRAPRVEGHPQHLGGLAPTGQAAGRRRRQHQEDQPRAHSAGQPQQPDHRDRRKVDHLPGHGRRCVAKCFTTGLLPEKPAGVTNQLPLVGTPREPVSTGSATPRAALYGSEAAEGAGNARRTNIWAAAD